MDNEPKHWGYPVSDTLKFFTDANTGFAGEDAIKKLNPQLRHGRTPPGETAYVVRVPAGARPLIPSAA